MDKTVVEKPTETMCFVGSDIPNDGTDRETHSNEFEEIQSVEELAKKRIEDSSLSRGKTNRNVASFSKGLHVVGGVLVSYVGSEPAIVLPPSVLAIGEGAFRGCLSISEVVFSDSVTMIQKSAFEGCINLRRITNYQNVQSFGDECFRYSGLSEITIGANVSFIGKYAFANMPNLERVFYKPGKDLKITGAFLRCERLAEVKMDRLYFFPSLRPFLELKNNEENRRPTYADAFVGTPFLQEVKKEITECRKKGICPECGGKIKRGLLHEKCADCGIDFNN